MGERSFFVEPGAIQGQRAEVAGPAARQIGRVLRLRPGDAIELLDNSGFVYAARLAEVARDLVRADVLERRHPDTEPRIRDKRRTRFYGMGGGAGGSSGSAASRDKTGDRF